MAKGERIEVTASEEEKARFEALAKSRGVSLSAWMRMAAIATADKQEGSQKVQEFRKKLSDTGFSQRDLAEVLGVDPENL